MRVSIRRFALALSLPAMAGAPALAQGAYYDDGQPPAAIALFTSENFYGDVREAFDPFASMHDLAFNDRARSVAVLAGQWELCEHANFTGRCVFVREDVADLGWFGLNSRVSSIRPIFDYTEAQHGLMFTRDNNGYIRYAHNEAYGYDTWNYGYSSSVRISVQHYGYSPDYWRFGYYDPRWGYDPYGFAWRPIGGPRYVSYVYRVHPRPVIINNYWKKNWGSSHKHWDRRGHRDDWRQKPNRNAGRDDGRGPGRGNDGWDRNRDRDRTDGRPGRGGDGRGSGTTTRERTDDRDRSWNPGDRAQRGGDSPRTDRSSPPRTGGGAIPTDPRRGDGRGDWSGSSAGTAAGTPPAGSGRDRDGARGERGRDRGGVRSGAGSAPAAPQAISSPPRVSTPSTPSSGRPTGDRPNGDGMRGDGGRRGGDRLLGAPSGGSPPATASPPRGGGDTGRRAATSPAPTPEARPSSPPTAVSRPAPAPRAETGRGRGGEGGGGRGGRRPGSSQD
ncbi:MAG: hypothetical protein CVT79_11605 [Alphaproteobacteria bacterium HGW-Alphaproteobacteria-18]|nr:MAG: hypothetical protein CVT79_11605 [Alphaproteobacteria bacterium HGW-Alphaproteobacteria-18]